MGGLSVAERAALQSAAGTRPVALERMQAIMRDIAAPHAADVDRQGRFPAETIAALREAGLMGAMIPREFGGEGLSFGEVAELCAVLGQGCASAAMVFAMHQIKVASLVSHGASSAWHRRFMREIATGQLLLASATTEAGVGGDVRSSICAINRNGETFALTKDATVISYGREADAILVTARRDADAANSDQVMVVLRRGQYTLEPLTTWDTLGMRGTGSIGHRLSAQAPVEQILPYAYAEISAELMLASSHLLWSSLWFGIAADALARAQAFVRAAARKAPGSVPPGALRLAEATAELQKMKASILGAIRRFEAARQDKDTLNSVGFAVEMNTLKLATSQMSVAIIQQALMICGIQGYKNDTPFSVGRHLRDALSGALMVSNDRILANTAGMLLVSKFDTGFEL